jgi:hypothetical protein
MNFILGIVYIPIYLNEIKAIFSLVISPTELQLVIILHLLFQQTSSCGRNTKV